KLPRLVVRDEHLAVAERGNDLLFWQTGGARDLVRGVTLGQRYGEHERECGRPQALERAAVASAPALPQRAHAARWGPGSRAAARCRGRRHRGWRQKGWRGSRGKTPDFRSGSRRPVLRSRTACRKRGTEALSAAAAQRGPTRSRQVPGFMGFTLVHEVLGFV